MKAIIGEYKREVILGFLSFLGGVKKKI